ncbi:hypothetical protein CONLIGDRAFT_634117 [Coniochaeta ligniaria NRRL 30616]|uniref:Uncharacterized protein n=1 Tax=Coniochaeta ligniaria NRRL 30616 TaxID=1408157 RepID=A0A1J7J3B2_9PEZI|nr:hypothetical protein CONLIGDRAFT_634117 [Coniochaeta ligniaria NRRL 30616]
MVRRQPRPRQWSWLLSHPGAGTPGSPLSVAAIHAAIRADIVRFQERRRRTTDALPCSHGCMALVTCDAPQPSCCPGSSSSR